MKTPTAPKKLSDAIELALEDLAIVEKHKDYVVDMGIFHAPEQYLKNICCVCFAGAVMTVTHQIPWEDPKMPSDFDVEWERVFRALDNVRIGDVCPALYWMRLDKTYNNYTHDRDIMPYEINKKVFRTQMTQLMNDLREDNL